MAKGNNNHDFDSILRRIGKMGRYQILHIVLLGISCIYSGFFSLANSFFGNVPEYWCEFDTKAINGTSEARMHHSDRSGYPHGVKNASQFVEVIDSDYQCENGTDACPNWVFDTTVYGRTVVTEWEFVCSREWLASLSQTTYMIGFFFGGLWVGAISDRFGRKKAWMVNLLLMIVSGCTASFMPSYWGFITARMISALAAPSMAICAFVMIMEILTEEQRMFHGVWYHAWFAAGIMGLSAAAYLLPYFRHLSLFISLVPIVSVPCYWLIDESARWLIAEGKLDQARKVIKRAARINRAEYPEDLLSETKSLLQTKEGDNIEMNVKKYSVIDLVRTPNMRYNFIIISYGWFLCSLVYYGLSFGAASLFGGPYLNVFISGAVEFPAFFIITWSMNAIGRKWSMASTLLLAGTCCLSMAVFEDFPIVKVVFSNIGKMGITGSFCVVYLYTAELFPTVVRTIAVGGGSACSRIAGICAPNIALLSVYWTPFPYVVFGILTVFGGFLMLFLPETLNQPFPETLQDGENFGKCGFRRLYNFPCINRCPEKDGDSDSQISKNNVNSSL